MNSQNNNQNFEYNRSSNDHLKFHEKFCELFQNGTIKNLKNIWILNEVAIPIKSTAIKKKNGTVRSVLKCSLNQNDFNNYPNSSSVNGEKETNNNTVQFKLPNAEIMHSTRSQRKNVGTFYACNYQGARSLPLIVFPRNEFKEDLKHPLNKVTCIEQNLNGDLNDLSIFFKSCYV